MASNKVTFQMTSYPAEYHYRLCLVTIGEEIAIELLLPLPRNTQSVHLHTHTLSQFTHKLAHWLTHTHALLSLTR